jgi:septal ring factor EnvC (AmiA/AmiB activator)
MATLQEKLEEIKQRLDQNISAVQKLHEEIKEKEKEAAAYTQPIIEDQGALKALQELIDD